MYKVCTRFVEHYSVQAMYTIKQAARLTGVSEASLRAWERRYSMARTPSTACPFTST